MIILKRGAASYRMSIRNNIRGLWSGALDRGQFESNMIRTFNEGLSTAFADGAKACGITPEDFTDAEQQAINDAADNELEYLDDLTEAVVEGSKANGGKLDPLFQRAEAWIVRYQDVVNRGKAMACSDQKFRWVLGPTEHCRTCAALAGQVRRGSFWRGHVLPQNAPNDQLECGGWRCACNLDPTDERMSRGKLPSLP